MKTSKFAAMAAALLLTGVTTAWAQDSDQSPSASDPAASTTAGKRGLSPEERQARREQWQSLTPDERERARAEQRARWEAMSPEEQDQARERRETRRQHAREHWQSLSPDEQARVREERRARFESLSPEEQAQIRERRQQRRQDGAGGGQKHGASDGQRGGGRSRRGG